MKHTALGALVVGAGWLAILLAFVMGSLGPALVGLVVVAGAQTARWRLRRTAVQVRRELPARLEIGQRATLRSEAVADRVPLWVEDDVDVPLALLARRQGGGRGMAWSEMDVEAVEAGTARWRSMVVRVGDPWGLHEEERRVGAVGHVSVAPEADWVQQGRRVGKRHTVQALVRGRQGSEPTPQVAAVREFQPGDRLRDVDWARSARLQSMHSRVREKVMSRPVLVLLDATASMRVHRRRSKMTSAARLAYGVVAAAQAAGVSADVLIFDETGMKRGHGRRLGEIAARLSSLDSPLPMDAPGLVEGEWSSATRAERGFLGAASALSLGRLPPAAPLEAAVAEAAHRDLALVVAILDAEGAPAAAERAVRRLRSAGHDVVLVVPATGMHHYRRAEARAEVLQLLHELRAQRERLAHRLRVVKVPVVLLGPGDVEGAIQEVATWAQ